MKSIWTLILAAGVATGLTACSDNSTDGNGDGGTTNTSNDDGDHGHDHANGDHDHDHDHGDHADTSTAEGTLTAFLGAMSDGHFSEALEMCDPGSEGHEQLNQMIDSSQKAKDNGFNLDGMFSGPFEGAEAEAVTVDDDRARYAVSLSTGNTVDVDLKQRDGKWWVIAPGTLFKPRAPQEGELEGMGTPPAGG